MMTYTTRKYISYPMCVVVCDSHQTLILVLGLEFEGREKEQIDKVT